ncbi:MAG TPA: phosphate ABC transporter ATP-binding protein PstB [Saprospiraceae bacterium]|nr:phosphate ABC transporter ATP-binding protein PstB [Saprospiraceae bacterium]HMP25722.1 phosphate ABC transporter ATP-binding protein PstB [Saprospiraceae bacterium]
MNTKLAIRNIRLSYGKQEVLKGISMDIPANQIVALIGPSGCGKSTLLRAMNRMHDLSPTARVQGDILLDGENIYAPGTDVVAIRRKIGMVFQKPNPFPKSIFDNVAYGLKINGERNRKRLQEIVERTLRSSYLWEEVKDHLYKSALELSGGQQQRLCIARAVAVTPQVLLMDEPCSALDPISTARVEELMLELKKDYTIVIVTHNMQQAQRVADRTAFMYLGEVIEYNDTAQLFNQPQQELTANYVSGTFG